MQPKAAQKYALHGKPKAPICEDCLRWQRFGPNCYVYWESKKTCSRKVRTMDEWDRMDQVLG